ncbi:hypothetical protein Rhow_007794 [Rhodococcus wratislaviensis]|uniref:Uncharacterized protein n=1 Tax=Rhodococcus wratislaviensis TaxID=44752 RepID=A0A402CIX8_RHOWR|nr:MULTISPECIES: hypothetical protein [Rhodococcus]GCE43564.1 hypothetical protein Rhow_007794 [Rhodococcus wratislaviensis]
MISDPNRVTAIGAGILGGQIARHSAFKGKDLSAHGMYADVNRADENIAKTRKR